MRLFAVITNYKKLSIVLLFPKQIFFTLIKVGLNKDSYICSFYITDLHKSNITTTKMPRLFIRAILLDKLDKFLCNFYSLIGNLFKHLKIFCIFRLKLCAYNISPAKKNFDARIYLLSQYLS